MTNVQKDRLIGFNASLKQRGVSVTIHTDDDVDVGIQRLALVEPITAKLREQFNLADEQVTHFVHVLRTDLHPDAAPGEQFDLQTVTEIERCDTEHTYRVQNFTDDAQRPAVLFHCVLA